MKTYWWQDKIDDYQQWHSLHVRVNPQSVTSGAPELLSGHNSRIQLQLRGYPLFWATVLHNHSGVWLIHNREHPDQNNLLSPIRSHTVEQMAAASSDTRTAQWCRYFARDLLDRPSPLLSAGEWLLRPMNAVTPAAPYSCNIPQTVKEWRFRSPVSNDHSGADWMLYSEDLPDLQSPEQVILVDWWFGGYLLLPRYQVEPQSSRLKYWRKIAREGKLPPVLVWYISGLASYLILDGHLRLQAAFDESVPPSFIVLSQYHESHYEPGPEAIDKIQQALQHQINRSPGKPDIDSINQRLIGLYQTRYGLHYSLSRAVLGNSSKWEDAVSDYLHRHNAQQWLPAILQRTEESI